MSVYAIWNNKGGVGKSYLSFQIACEYALQHPDKKVLVVDLCPQANVSTILLGGIIKGEEVLTDINTKANKRTISGYVKEKLISSYTHINSGSKYAVQVSTINPSIPENVYLVVGDEELENQASGILYAASAQSVQDSWRLVHTWISEMITDIQKSWNNADNTVFIDCNPSFSIYTELALSAADRLIIPFTADGSSKRSVKAILSLVYGITRYTGDSVSDFYTKTKQYRLTLPRIYMYVGNKLTSMYSSSAKAFSSVVEEIGNEIFAVWQKHPELFCLHPSGAGTPSSRSAFNKMFQFQIRDSNTASVVSTAMGIPVSSITAGTVNLLNKNVVVNQTQIDQILDNLRFLVNEIE